MKEKRIEKEELFSILYNTINGADFDDLNEAVYKISDVAGYRKQRDRYYFEEGKPPVLIETSENKQSEGEWVFRGDGAYGRTRCYCSACGKHSGIGGIRANQLKPFCPNCGAKMKGASNG